jgi:hypothetical protein
MKIIAQTPIAIAPSMMPVRRELRHRLRQESVITARNCDSKTFKSNRLHGIDRPQPIETQGWINSGQQAAAGDD